MSFVFDSFITTHKCYTSFTGTNFRDSHWERVFEFDALSHIAPTVRIDVAG
jgi:hypothetical protein